ncbi:MAG: D-glycerate dehydrogenase [Bacteroidetes bacterium]|nr:D-glycerate dehydrogenase [Bacteroidota bacterium]
MKVFITRIISQAGIQLMKKNGIEFTQWEEKRDLTQEELIATCQNYDALISVGQDKIDKHFLNSCKHLKTVAQMAVGFDNIDIAEATKLKIPIGNTPGVLSAATADTAFLLMLAVSRKAIFQHKRILRGEWGFYEPTANLGIELYGKTLGIYGLGKIGFELAVRCRNAYNMKVVYCNRNPNPLADQELEAKKMSFDELLAQSDVLSVNTALTPETKGIFNLDAFRKMKKNAIFINTARGGIHNEPDLIKALEDGMIWGAGLDVTNPEPMLPDNPLLEMPNVAVFPHIGSATEETRNAMSRLAAENIVAAYKRERLLHLVNPEVYNG